MGKVAEYVEARALRVYYAAMDRDDYSVARQAAEVACGHYLGLMRRFNVPATGQQYHEARTAFIEWWDRMHQAPDGIYADA